MTPRARGARNAGGNHYARRRAQVAASLAEPLPLGAALDSHDTWAEAKLQAEILDLCATLDGRLQAQFPGVPGIRVLVFHDQDSRRNVRGFPDLVIAGPGGVIYAELKREATTKHKARERPEQTEWLDTLAAGGAAAYLWRPSDWQAGAIQNELHRIARPRSGFAARPGRPVPPPATPRRKCGCLAGEAHTCPVWGPPS